MSKDATKSTAARITDNGGDDGVVDLDASGGGGSSGAAGGGVGADRQADSLDARPAAQTQLQAENERLRAENELLREWKATELKRQLAALGTVERLRTMLTRIRNNAEGWHGDDAAKGRALAVIAKWAQEALDA